MFFAPSKSRQRAKNRNMGFSKTIDHTKIKIQMPTPSQEPQVLSKAPKQDLEDLDVLCTLIILKESQYWEQWCIKDLCISM